MRSYRKRAGRVSAPGVTSGRAIVGREFPQILKLLKYFEFFAWALVPPVTVNVYNNAIKAEARIANR